ncbi:hypothetical protein BpHYR1_005689, partial [Brachionus plicatilis]
MKDNLASNIYDKLFDFRKINQIRSSDGVFYDNVASPIATNVNSVQQVRNLKNPVMSSLGLGFNETDNFYFVDTSSSSSNYSSYNKFTFSECGSVKFSTIGSKISKKSKINRSKSLVLKKTRNLDILKQNYIESNQVIYYPSQAYNKL